MSQKVYDLIIIGGGISGAGLALESSKKSLNTLLLEKRHFFQAASSNNLRIIHGGFRYLQSLSFARTFESIKAQAYLLKEYPSFISQLPCLMPLNKSGLKSKIPLSAANVFFSILCKLAGVESPANKILTSDEADKQISRLKGLFPNAALFWNDAVINDLEGFHATLLSEIKRFGGEAYDGKEVCEVTSDGQFLKVRVQNNEFISHKVVNCSGAWLGKIKINLPGYTKYNQNWCKAFNILINKKIEDRNAIAIESNPHEGGKRMYFMVPRGEYTAIGTEYTSMKGEPDKVETDEVEIAAFINSLNNSLPQLNLSIADVCHTESGVLPYIHRTKRVFKLVGREKIYKFGNYFEVLSTKYTTFQPQALRVLKMLQIVK